VKKRITALLLALSLVLGVSISAPGPAAAYGLNGGHFSMNSDGLGDGDLDVCFEYQGDFNVAYNRQVIMNGVGIWGAALDLNFTNLGNSCGTANVQFTWEVSSSDPTCAGNQIAWVNDAGANDTFKHIYFNQACANFQWTGGSTPIAYGYMDPESVAMHEVGHAFGLAHGSPTRIMNLTSSCYWSTQVQYDATHNISQDDANGIRSLYTSIDKSGSWPSEISCIE
jgi:hypothetical protein